MITTRGTGDHDAVVVQTSSPTMQASVAGLLCAGSRARLLTGSVHEGLDDSTRRLECRRRNRVGCALRGWQPLPNGRPERKGVRHDRHDDGLRLDLPGRDSGEHRRRHRPAIPQRSRGRAAGVAPSVRTTRPHIQALLRCPGRERRASRRSPTAGVRRATPLLQGARHRACGWVRPETVGGLEPARHLSPRPRKSDAQTAAVHRLPHALRRPSAARRHVHEESLVPPPRSSTRM